MAHSSILAIDNGELGCALTFTGHPKHSGRNIELDKEGRES